MGMCQRREDAEGSEGKVDGLSGDEYKVSVTGLAFFVICLDRQSADWLTAFATHFLNGMRIISDNENRVSFLFKIL